MPYFTSATERMALPSNEKYWVEFRQRLTSGDQDAANEAINEFLVDTAATMPRVDARLHVTADEPVLLARMIVAWNLDDEAGTVLPINRDTVGQMSREDRDAIIARIRELNPRLRGKERGN